MIAHHDKATYKESLYVESIGTGRHGSNCTRKQEQEAESSHLLQHRAESNPCEGLDDKYPALALKDILAPARLYFLSFPKYSH